jgi:diguanylate cyclase (GGDEF)-like protein/PAS domain S-box-containing protein
MPDQPHGATSAPHPTAPTPAGPALPRDQLQVPEAVLWFHSVVAHAEELLAVLDEDGTVKYVSPSSETLLGYPPKDLVGNMLGSLSDVDLASLTATLLEQPGAPIALEGTLKHRDGTSRAFEGSVTNLLDDPAVRGYVVNARDVTDRRDAEAARRRSEMALRAIVQASPVAILALDRRGRVHVWNVACEHLFGWTAADIVGAKAPFDSGDPDLEHLVGRAFAGETITDYEAQLTTRDGVPLDVNLAIAPLRDSAGRAVTAVVILTDVTEQKRAQRAVAASEARFRSLVQHLTDMVLVLGEEGTVSYVSPSACVFIGQPAEELIGGPPPFDAMWPEDVALMRELFQQLRAVPGSTETVTTRLRRGDGEFRWVEMVAFNQLDDPAVRGIVTNSRDITDRVDADAAIRASEERLQALLASASDVISVIDADGKLRYTSAVATHVLGYPEGAGYGEQIFDLVHTDDRASIVELFDRAREVRGMFRPIELRLQRADGSWMYAEVLANNMLDDPSVQGIVVTIRDITERKVAEDALRASERRLREGEAHYRAVVDDQTELVCRYRPDTTLTFVNRAFAEFFGRSPSELLGSPLIDLFTPVERAAELERLQQFGPGNEVQTQEDWEHAQDGSVHWYHWTDRAFLDDEGNVIEFQSVGHDITERRRTAVLTSHQAEILEQVARGVPLEETLTTIARTVEDHFPRLVCALSLLAADGKSLQVGACPSLPIGFWEAIDDLPVGPLSLSSGTAAHRRASVAVSDIATDALWADHRDIAQAFDLRAAWSTPILASDGHSVLGTLDVYARVPQAPEEEHEQILSLLAHLASIAIERKAFEERLAHQSMHDPLTGLPNRLLFLDRLSLAIARCRRMHREVAVLFIDLDRFKNVNDSVGHDAGDELLVSVARRLESVLRPGDTVARFGGDEFTILCDDLTTATSRERAVEIAERLLEAVAQPFILGGAQTFVSASVGIALATGDERPEELLRDADAAMYHAKESGRGRVEVFDETMRARAVVRHATENDLHRALEHGEMLLFFQPVIALREGRCVGAEALVRWQHPERGLMVPDEFVPLAEETGLVVELGTWVLETAAKEAARWQLDNDQPFVVSVNLSARQLAQPGLAERLAAVIERTGVDPQNLCLEITESVLMEDAEAVISVVERVRALGVQLSIDDFGTGYSSLGYLKRFPVNAVKIDRSFVDGLGTDPGDAAIVSAVIGLAHALDLNVVAEGVETEHQLAELIALGCDEAQGYYFAPPQPVEDLRSLIGRKRTWRPPGARLMTAATANERNRRAE